MWLRTWVSYSRERGPGQCHASVPRFGTKSRRGQNGSECRPWAYEGAHCHQNGRCRAGSVSQDGISSGSVAPIPFVVKLVFSLSIPWAYIILKLEKCVKPQTVPLTHNSNHLKEWTVYKIPICCMSLYICLLRNERTWLLNHSFEWRQVFPPPHAPKHIPQG